jgi:hypothetical protein
MRKGCMAAAVLLLCAGQGGGVAAQQRQRQDETQPRLTAQQQQQVRRIARQMGGRRPGLPDCVEVCRVEDTFPHSKEFRVSSLLSREQLTIKFTDETRFYIDEMVPVGDLKVGDTIVVEGSPTAMIVGRMSSQEEGSIRRISNAVKDGLTEADKEAFDVAPFPDTPKTNVAVKGTITSLEPMTLTTEDGINIQLVLGDQTEMLRLKAAASSDIDRRNDLVVIGQPAEGGDGWVAEIVYRGDVRRVIDLLLRDIIHPKAIDLQRRGG